LRSKHKQLFTAAIRHGRLFLVYIVQLITHLKNWGTGLIGLVLLLAESFPSFASIFPDGRGDRIVVGVGIGLLVSAYRIFEDDHAQIEELEGAAGPEPRAGEPVLVVRNLDRVIGAISPVPPPDLAKIEREAWRAALEEFDREAERLRPRSFIDFAFQDEALRDRETYEQDVARYVEAMRQHGEILFRYLTALQWSPPAGYRQHRAHTGKQRIAGDRAATRLETRQRSGAGLDTGWCRTGEAVTPQRDQGICSGPVAVRIRS
jgi:hypothetical protein